jgi:protein TIF31
MFPSDLNYLSEDSAVASENGTKPQLFRHKLSCLRQELVEAFCDTKYVEFVKHAALQIQKLKAATAASSAADDAASSENNIEKAKEIVKELTSSEDKAAAAADEEKKNVEIIENACRHVKSWKTGEFDIRFNPNMYQSHVTLSASDEFATRDAELLREASDFLLNTQIPQFVKDLQDHTMFICDGSTLSEMMHSRGINIRYLGRILKELAASTTPSSEYAQAIVLNELVARSSKRVFRQYIQNVASLNLAQAISHYLNCYLSNLVKTTASSITSNLPVATTITVTVNSASSSTSPAATNVSTNNANSAQQQANATDAKKKKKNQKNKSGKAALQEQMNSSDWSSLTARSLWAQIREEALAQYGYEIKK